MGIVSRAAELFDSVGSERDKAAGGDERTSIVDGGELVRGGQPHDQVAVAHGACARRYDEPGISGLRQSRERVLDIGRAARVYRARLKAQHWRDGLDDAPLSNAGRDVGVSKDPDALEAGRNLLQQLQPFAADAVVEASEPGGVAA